MVPRFLISFWEKTRPLYRPLSLPYGLGLRLREEAYRRGWFRQSHPGVFSLVVGNLSLGGEGKTPFTLLLAELVRGLGLKPVVILRGYGGREVSPQIVSEGKGPLLSFQKVGEEALLYALRLSGVPVVVGKDRLAAARLARERFSPDILLFDDAFQHLRLKADLYFLVVSAAKDPFRERLFPAGRLREPLRAVRRAGAIFITRANLFPERAAYLKERFTRLGIPVFQLSFEPGPLTVLGPSGFGIYPGKRPRKIGAFCGVGDPHNFRKMLEKRGFEILLWRTFPDHYFYREKDLRHLSEKAQALGAEVLVTTEKDLLKIPQKASLLPVLALSLLVRPPREVTEFIKQSLSPLFSSSPWHNR